MSEPSGDLGFFDEELLADLGAEGSGVHEFQGDFFVDEAIVGFVDFAHAAFSDRGSDDVSVVYDGAAVELGTLSIGIFCVIGDDYGCATSKTQAFAPGDGRRNLYGQ